MRTVKLLVLPVFAAWGPLWADTIIIDLRGGGAFTEIQPAIDAAAANDDGAVDIADAIAVLGHLFAGAGDLPEPFGECGVDPTADDMSCHEYPPCGQ